MKKLLIILILAACCLLFSASFALGGYGIEIALPDVPKGTELNFAQYVSYFYTFGLSLVAILALGGLVIGGFLYMLSDTISSKETAKQYIWSALSSLVLLLSAYLILNTINPNLVSLQPPTLQKIEAPSKTSTPPDPTKIYCIDGSSCDIKTQKCLCYQTLINKITAHYTCSCVSK